ncbi:unnamed protein product [Urochloa decumbens]|uniref:Uncharacterized protein n=1 Tax=Urochloa decumbens TaxID=240449 RepID=A0ABC9BAW2_9POAL
MAGSDRELRRSRRLMRKEELSACASEQDLILMLKREMKALMARRREEWALEDRVAGKKVQSVGEEAEPAARAAKKRKTVVKRKVPHRLIDYIILNPHNPWNGYPEEKLGKCPQKFREFYAKEKARADKLLEYQQALIKQFRTKGYAEDYTEVSDNDEEN